MRVLSIFGTRPEAIKLAPVIRELQSRSGAESVVCVTAQHRELLDQVNDLFGIVPDYDLDLMRPGQELSELTASVFQQLPAVLKAVKPDWVLVQGDTTTVMAAALTAFYSRIKVGHVEAGLRTFNKWHPFPEEINRKVAGVAADLHFAPTSTARENLLREGVPEADVHVTGNPIIDALQYIAGQEFNPGPGVLKELPSDREIVLLTAHRRENFGAPLVSICEAVKVLAGMEDLGLQFVYPVHPNPNVKDVVEGILSEVENVSLLEPVDYRTMVYLMSRSKLVLTDSGGLQEEAPALGVPVFVMREVTERPEGVAAGVAKLVGTDSGAIISAVRDILLNAGEYDKMQGAKNPYGDGKAAERIVSLLMDR